MRPIIPDKSVKFGNPSSNTALEKFHPKPSEAAFSPGFFAITSDRKLLMTSYAMWLYSGGYTDVTLEFGDSMSNRSGDQIFEPLTL